MPNGGSGTNYCFKTMDVSMFHFRVSLMSLKLGSTFALFARWHSFGLRSQEKVLIS